MKPDSVAAVTLPMGEVCGQRGTQKQRFST
jgi:hypothetical protein